MNTANIAAYAEWQWIVWALLAVTSVAGLLAVVSPRLFSRLATFGGRWVDSSKYLDKFDRRVEVDSHLLHYSRLLGLTSITAVLVLAIFIWPFQFSGQWMVWTLLAAIGAAGLLAIVSPRGFARLAAFGNIWVDSDKVLKQLDRRVEVDTHLLHHCRLLGVVTVVAASVLAILLI